MAASKSLSGLMKKINLSTPAYIALIAYLILSITVLLPMDYPYYDDEKKQYHVVKYRFAERFLMVIMMAIPIALSVYSINCMMVGKCTILSYIVSLITVFWIALFVITALLFAFVKN